MTGNEMLAQLGQRMEDTASLEYTATIKLEALNNAQLRVATLLTDEYLTELEHTQSNVSLTAGALTFTDLESAASNLVLNARIQQVKINSGKFTTLVTFESSKELLDNSYLTATAETPYSWVHNETIYVLPTATSAVDVYYLYRPTTLAESDDECELATSLHQTVLDFAEEALWLTANRSARASEAGNRAIGYIKSLIGE